MTYYSFDPRTQIRNAIGTKKDYNHDDIDEYCLSITHNNRDYDIPLLMPDETRSENAYTMPYIEMILISSPVRVHDITGDIREKETYIDFNIWYTNIDYISACSFGRTIADKLVDLVMTYRHSVTSVWWMEVVNDGRELLEEGDGRQSYFHRVVEVYANHWG
jgi:hypothetical protein